MRFARLGLSALVVVALAGAIAAPGAAARSRPSSPARSVPVVDARVVGTFAMSATVTVAVHVRGERVGQRLARTWTIVPRGCQGSVCQLLALDRVRGGGQHDQLTLQRVGSGRYVGSGVFYVALSCLGRIDPYGSRVPYRITLTVRGATIVQGIRFAQRIAATYVNPRRSDRTRCPIGPSHDAASYLGRLGSPLPSPPTVTFSTVFGSAGDTASFTDTSTPGLGGAPIVGWHWDFGDPASGSQDIATAQDPSHTFSAPGNYPVTLTVTDANGFQSFTTLEVTAPP